MRGSPRRSGSTAASASIKRKRSYRCSSLIGTVGKKQHERSLNSQAGIGEPIALSTLTEGDLWGPKAVAYSRFKLGDPAAIARCAASMARIVASLLATLPHAGRWYVSHIPTVVHENAIHAVAERVARRLRLPLLELRKHRISLRYRSHGFALRLRRLRGRVFSAPRLPAAGSTVFLLDDAYVTGELFHVAAAALGGERRVRIMPLVVAKLDVRHPEYEFLFNGALYLERSVRAVLRVVRDPRYRVTGFLLMLLHDMLPDDRT